MKKLLALVLALLAGPLRAFAHDLDQPIQTLTQSAADWRWLREHGEVQFTSSSAELRYQRAMNRLETAILALEDLAGGGLPGDNYRGRAVVTIQQNVASSYAAAAIAALPAFVTQDDFGLVDHVARQVMGSKVPATLGAFYAHASRPSPLNRRGTAARAVLDQVMSSYQLDALARLGAFVSPDDAEFVAFLVGDATSSAVAELLAAFDTHPSEVRPGSRKGKAARLVVEAVTSSYKKDCLAALPGYVAEADLGPLQDLIGSTTSSRLAAALRQFFATR